jgi:hypothetical protein
MPEVDRAHHFGRGFVRGLIAGALIGALAVWSVVR